MGNTCQLNKRSNRDQFRRIKPEGKTKQKFNTEKKPCNRRARPFIESELKNCPKMSKSCKNCNNSNHFAQMCRSQQVNEIPEATESSEEESNLIQTL